MKKSKLQIATKILAIIVICLMSFAGVYVQKLNKMENVVKEFKLGKDLKGYREIILKVSKTDGDNNSDVLTTANYEKSRNIIEKRIREMGVEDFSISVDKNSGSIYIQIPEDSNTDRVVSNITETGTVELKDSEDGTVYLSNNNLNKAVALYSTQSTGTAVYLELQFNKDGKNSLKSLSENDYKTLPEESNSTESNTTSENKENEENKENKDTTQKKVTLYISGAEAVTTSFDEPVLDGKIDLSMGGASTDGATISQRLQSASTIANIINNGPMPVKYTVDENQYVKTEISQKTIKTTIIFIAIIVVIALVYMIVKYKIKGLFAAISYAGFIGLYLLLLRYTNVIISLDGIAGIVVISIINYLFTIKLLSLGESYKKEYVKLLLKLLPVFVVSIIFCFIRMSSLRSIGMVMFWGLALLALYNRYITGTLVEQKVGE